MNKKLKFIQEVGCSEQGVGKYKNFLLATFYSLFAFILIFVVQFSIVNFQLFIVPYVFALDTPTTHRIVCLGDSVTLGYGRSFRTSNGETCTINAEQGRMTATMVEEFNNSIRGRHYTDLIIAGGRDDLYGGRTIQQVKDNLSTIYRGAKTDGIRVIAMTILPSKTYREYRAALQPQFEELNRWIMNNTDVDVKINAYELLSDPSDPQATNPRYLAEDTLHPNAEGYQLIVRTIVERAFGGTPAAQPTGPAITNNSPTPQSNFSGTAVTLEAPFGTTTSIEGSGSYIVNYSRIVFAFAGGIAGGLAMLMLIIAGIQIMTSSGEEQIKQAKERLQGALLGLVLLSTGGLLLYFINPCFFSFEDARTCATRTSGAGVSSAPTSVPQSNGTSTPSSSIPINPGTMISPDGSRYQLTRDDVLWAGRMLQYESGGDTEQHAAEIIWIAAQRHFWLSGNSSRTFTQTMQDFSQPINPAWRRNGDACRPGALFNGRPNYATTDSCTERLLALRDEAATKPWSELSPIPKRIVEAFATGQLANPVTGITDFASQSQRSDGTIVQIGCNRRDLVFIRNGYPGGGDCETPERNHLFASKRGNTDSSRAGFERMRVEPATSS